MCAHGGEGEVGGQTRVLGAHAPLIPARENSHPGEFFVNISSFPSIAVDVADAPAVTGRSSKKPRERERERERGRGRKIGREREAERERAAYSDGGRVRENSGKVVCTHPPASRV